MQPYALRYCSNLDHSRGTKARGPEQGLQRTLIRFLHGTLPAAFQQESLSYEPP